MGEAAQIVGLICLTALALALLAHRFDWAKLRKSPSVDALQTRCDELEQRCRQLSSDAVDLALRLQKQEGTTETSIKRLESNFSELVATRSQSRLRGSLG
jgi:hypothetical protein